MRKINFLLTKVADGFDCVRFSKTSYLKADMSKFKPWLHDESRVRSADSSKAYSKGRDFNCRFLCWDLLRYFAIFENSSVL